MTFAIPADHPALPGHFPGRPVVPGVLLLEQVLLAIEAECGALPALELPQVKFARPLLPGDRASVLLERREPGNAVMRWRFRVLRDDGALLASGEVSS